jgi:hypothetical protein
MHVLLTVLAESIAGFLSSRADPAWKLAADRRASPVIAGNPRTTDARPTQPAVE